MSRFEKKCFIGSVALHGLLVVSFVFGSAFLASKQPEKLPPVITILDAKVTDRLIASGGNPNASPAPAAPPKIETPPPPLPEPPKVEVKPKEPEPEPEPPKPKKPEVVKKVEKEKPVLPKEKPVETKTVQTAKSNPTTKTPSYLKPVKITNDTARVQQELAAKAAREKAQRAAQAAQAEWNKYAAEQRRVASEAGRIIGNVGSTLGRTTVAEPVGPGGAAYANYASLIIERYKTAVYESHPQSDEDAEAVIRVVIARNGTVRSSQWVRRTGNPVLNKAVDRAMNSVRSLPEFPPEAKDSERSFNITIAFEARRVSA